jgi:hypothetical protein
MAAFRFPMKPTAKCQDSLARMKLRAGSHSRDEPYRQDHGGDDHITTLRRAVPPYQAVISAHLKEWQVTKEITRRTNKYLFIDGEFWP